MIDCPNCKSLDNAKEEDRTACRVCGRKGCSLCIVMEMCIDCYVKRFGSGFIPEYFHEKEIKVIA